MTPNPTANPLAALGINTTRPAAGSNQALEISALESADELGPGSQDGGFLDILQLLNVPVPIEDALMPAFQLADNPTTLTPQQMNQAALPEAIPFTPHLARDTGTGELPPQGGRSLPPVPEPTLFQLLAKPASEPSLPASTVVGTSLEPAKTQPLKPVFNLATANPSTGSVSDTVPPVAAVATALPAELSAQLKLPDTDPMEALRASAQQNLTQVVAEPAASFTVREESAIELVRTPSGLSAYDKPNPLQNTTAALPLARPAGSPGWDQGLGQRILWMVGNGLGQAELRLDPPHLGNINVRIAMVDDQAQVVFQAAHPAAREALESALPRLREMFADQQIQLGDADVRGQDGQQPGEHEQGDRSGEATDGSTEPHQQGAGVDAGTDVESVESVRRGVTEYALVDEFV